MLPPLEALPPVSPPDVRVVIELADKRMTFETDNAEFFALAAREVAKVFYHLESKNKLSK